MTPSLRRTALVWMTILVTVVGLITTLIAYAYVRNQADEFLDGQLRQIALNSGYGTSAVRVPPAADLDPEDQFAITIWDARGDILHRSLPNVNLPRQGHSGFVNLVVDGTRWHVYTLVGEHRSVQVAQREEVRAEIIEGAALGAAAPIVIVIPLSWIVVGWAMNRMLRRLTELEGEIAVRGALAEEPIPLEGVPAEVRPLVESMNRLIERLHTAVETQRRFLADAAHELRTPLAAMQIQVDNLAEGSGSPEKSVAQLAAGVRRASALVNQLLRLARLDEPPPATHTSLDVGALLLESIADIVPVAERKGIDVGVHIGTAAVCKAVEADLRALLGVLLDNAVRYTPSGGSVEVKLFEKDGRTVAEILDSGVGLPKGQEARIFDRFFRGAPAEAEGTGLGLAIARRLAERNAWQLTVENRTDGQNGVRARIAFQLIRS